MSERQQYKATYGKAYVEEDVYSLSIKRIERLYQLFDTIVVMFSGGKDSTAVLNMVTTVANRLGKTPVKVFFWDEEAISFEVEDYMRRTAARPDIDLSWFCIQINHRNACSKEQPYWITWNPDERDKWVRPMPADAITVIPGYDWRNNPCALPDLSAMVLNDPKLGRVCQVMGIRAEESLVRTRAVTRRQFDNYIVEVATGNSWGQLSIKLQTPIYKAYPIYDWKTEDVWTAPARFGWDYCEAYDLMEMAGIRARDQRLAPPFGEQPFRSLWMWKVCFPALWEKMCERVPGASAAALYSTTDLYRAGRRGKPPHQSWEQFLQAVIEEHPPHMRPGIVDRMKQMINRHYKLTQDPIAPYVPHPDTGLSWSLMVKIAEIADTKNRNDPIIEAGKLRNQCKGDEVLMWAKYSADLENMDKGIDEVPEGIEEPEVEPEDPNI